MVGKPKVKEPECHKALLASPQRDRDHVQKRTVSSSSWSEHNLFTGQTLSLTDRLLEVSPSDTANTATIAQLVLHRLEGTSSKFPS